MEWNVRRRTSTELADNEYSLSSQLRLDVEKLFNRVCKNRVRAWPESRDTLNFWPLNANSSRTTNVTDLKFGMRAQGQS